MPLCGQAILSGGRSERERRGGRGGRGSCKGGLIACLFVISMVGWG